MGKQCGAFRLRHAAPADRLFDKLLRMRLALCRGLQVAVNQHDLHARLGGHEGDAGAHEAGA